MPFTLTAEDSLVIVKTAGSISLDDRLEIVRQLGELGEKNTHPDGLGLVINHENAEIDIEPEEAFDFAKSIMRLQEDGQFAFTYVVAPEKFRQLIDLSVAPAMTRGISISVCESLGEAFNNIAARFPSHYRARNRGGHR